MRRTHTYIGIFGSMLDEVDKLKKTCVEMQGEYEGSEKEDEYIVTHEELRKRLRQEKESTVLIDINK